MPDTDPALVEVTSDVVSAYLARNHVPPAEIAADVADEAVSMTVYEDFVVDMVSQGATIIGLYPMTNGANEALFDRWRAEKGR